MLGGGDDVGGLIHCAQRAGSQGLALGVYQSQAPVSKQKSKQYKTEAVPSQQCPPTCNQIVVLEEHQHRVAAVGRQRHRLHGRLRQQQQ